MLKQTFVNMKFGEVLIDQSQIFYLRKNVFAFVNLRPFKPGHVILCPVKSIKKYSDLSESEAIEIWISAKKIGDNLKRFYNVEAIEYAIQDGPDAGQTIDHVHIHIIPIQKNKQNNNDENIDAPGRALRTLEEMAWEADLYRQNFNLK